jgi:alpha-1,2-mannosyltransferase
MRGLIGAWNSGDWLTRERMRLVAVTVLVVSVAVFGVLIATSNGLSDIAGRPLGTDFSNIYAAGTHVLDGHPGAPFDLVSQYAREQAIFGPDTPIYGWHYPPFLLFVAAALALLPYLPALGAWQGITFAFYLVSVRAIVGASARAAAGVADRTWLLLAAAFPAVIVNLGHGHNGFLTAALLGGGLILLDRRPLLAGVLFGLLAYKPQFGPMIPLVLIATGRWRTVAAAAATVAMLIAISTAAFGTDIWQAFLASATVTRVVVLENGALDWHKLQSVFGWVRMIGGPVNVAYTLQAIVAVLVSVSLVRLWRSAATFDVKAAALSIATILATPYSLDYDMMVLAPAIAFLATDGVRHGFGPGEKSVFAMLWLVPLFARSAATATLVPLGFLTMAVAFGMLLHRGMKPARPYE